MWALPNAENRAHTENNLWLCISNWGLLGSQMGEYSDPETELPLPSCRFPGGSDFEYLFQGGIWIGAVVNDTPFVSLGCDGWWWIHELWPDSGTIGAIVKNEWWGDQEFIAVYTDTSPDIPLSPQSQDPFDNRPHRPLDVRITQHSLCWQTPGYDDFVILDYTIVNIGSCFLSEVCVGFYMDCDIQHTDENPYGPCGALDDITGFLHVYEGDTVNIAWMADNDGHGVYGENIWTDVSPRSVIGMRVLHTPNPDLQMAYNWWVCHTAGHPKDWGPWIASNQDVWEAMNPYGSGNLFPDNVLGTPGGDVSKYFIMSNGEFDYDQIYSCIWPDDHPEEGWLSPSPECTNLANGYDTRFLLSFGPFDQIAPGDSLHFVVACMAGDNFHVDPMNLAQDPNMTNPDRFYSNLDFSNLVENSEIALLVYQSGYTLPPPGPPENLRLIGTTDSTVGLSWSPKAYHSLLGYNLYRSTVAGEHNDPPINGSVITDTVFQDTGLHATEVYYYAVSSVDTSFVQGCLSPDLEVAVGRPTAPTGLTAESQKDMVTLSWQHNPEGDVIGYKVYRTEDCTTYAFVDSVGWQNIFWDHTVTNGIIYYYRITAVDSTQLESFPSDTVWALPMAFDSGVVVLDLTNAETFEWDFNYGDSVDEFYSRALAPYEFAFLHHDSCNSYTDLVSLTELSPYPVCILHCEELIHFCHPMNQNRVVILTHYLRAGGKMIIEGREALFNWLGFPIGLYDVEVVKWWAPVSYDFAYNGLGLDSVYRDGITILDTTWEFVGARSELPEYPDLDIDTSRVNSSIDPALLQLHGKLPGIGYVIPQDWQEIIYTFHSAYSDTSSFEGMPVAIRHLSPDHHVIFFCFPLYFIKEDQATELLHQALSDLGMDPTGVEEDEGQENAPFSFSVKQNYPNPFNPETVIEYELPKGYQVEIAVYNILGQKVRTLLEEYQTVGRHRMLWDGRDDGGKEVSSGIYLYRIRTSEFSQTKKMVLLR
jgi:hypothetical protein